MIIPGEKKIIGNIVVERSLDTEHHQEYITCRDRLGHEHKLTVPLYTTRETEAGLIHDAHDAESAIMDACRLLEAKERTAIEEAHRRGYKLPHEDQR